MEKQRIVIAVDGPSGAGKSTLSRRAAGILGLRYLDTGAIYRTVGLAVRRAGIDPLDEAEVKNLLDTLEIAVEFGGEGEQYMLLHGEDVTGELRTDEISRYASNVSAYAAVRDYLMETQRGVARLHDVIMDGRDIGTVVLPDAPLKVFLTADPEVRARRRYEELLEKGEDVTLESVAKALNERDRNDSARAVAPLRRAPDAVTLDTTPCSLEQSVELFQEIIRERFGI